MIPIILFESLTVILGDIDASGLNVLSAEYSKPGSKILTLLILLIVLDWGNTWPPEPVVDAMLTNVGSVT